MFGEYSAVTTPLKPYSLEHMALDETKKPPKARQGLRHDLLRDTAQQVKEWERRRLCSRKNLEKRKREFCRLKQQLTEINAKKQKQHQKKLEVK
eukprot:m.107170 g.107170  ORF g.107170 m.107170 type:complete len:94 (-) comp13916_c1_seq3:2143-2424(-)